MAKNKEIAKQQPVRTLTRDHITTLKAIMINKNKIKLDQEAVSSDVKGLSEKLGWPAKKVNLIISMMIKEEEKGGAIQESSEVVEMVEQILGVKATMDDVGDDETALPSENEKSEKSEKE